MKTTKITKITIISLLLIHNSLTITTHKYTPVYIAEIITSGAKTPESLPKDFTLDYITQYGLDTVTPNGLRMMYVLGQRMNKDYPSIFGKTYNHRRVNVYTSNRKSSQTSARAHLMGLYETADNTVVRGNDKSRLTMPPLNGAKGTMDISTALPFGYKPFILDIQEDSEDTLFVNRIGEVCPKADRILGAMRNNKTQELNSVTQNVNSYLIDRGLDPKEYYNSKAWTASMIDQFYHILHSFYYENSRIFDKMSEDEYKRLQIFHGMYMDTVHFQNWNFTRIYTTKIAQTFLNQMSNEVIDDDIDLEFSLFSADQKNLMAFLSAMRLTSVYCLKKRFYQDYESYSCLDPPEYGSSLIFELAKVVSQNKGGNGSDPKSNKFIPIDDEYYVKVSYNGVDIPFCQNDYNFDRVYCPFSKFLRTAQDTFIFDEFDELCGNEELDVIKMKKLVDTDVIYERVEKYLIYGNIYLFLMVVLSIVKVRYSTGKKVNSAIKNYEDIASNRNANRDAGLPAGFNLQSLDTEQGAETERKEGYHVNVERLDDLDDTFEEEEEEKGKGEIMSRRTQNAGEFDAGKGNAGEEDIAI